MSLPRLQISADGRRLCRADGSPFFYLGDTAWELFHRLSLEEAACYLATRARQGFTVIQAVALAEEDGLDAPNARGDLPLADHDPERPLEPYWEQVDEIVHLANQQGLYLGFLPTWGDKWNRLWGVGPEIFTPENARNYGRWLGRRYREAGLIWILGGDRPVQTERQCRILQALAAGLREGDDGSHLITFHPAGGDRSSALTMHAESWLDFHLLQTGHGRDNACRVWCRHARNLWPRRPFVNGEPSYEEHPNFFRQGDEGYLDQHDVRRELYWTICSGAAGYTYGAHPVWQFFDRGRQPVNGPRLTWREALSLPGAEQLRFARNLLELRPTPDREPVDHLVHATAPDATGEVAACRAADGSWVWVYLPLGQRVEVELSMLAAPRVRCRFWNPRTGVSGPDTELPGGAPARFLPPPALDGGRDWLLILEDPARLPPLPEKI